MGVENGPEFGGAAEGASIEKVGELGGTGRTLDLIDDERLEGMLERLGEAGWAFGGGGNPQTGEIGIGFVVDHVSGRVVSEDELRAGLPVVDDDGELLDGFNVGTTDGEAYVEYEGLIDDRFEQFVDAAVAFLAASE
jgi:hypothetical protein